MPPSDSGISKAATKSVPSATLIQARRDPPAKPGEASAFSDAHCGVLTMAASPTGAVVALNAGGHYLVASSEGGSIEVYEMPRCTKAGSLETNGDIIEEF